MDLQVKPEDVHDGIPIALISSQQVSERLLGRQLISPWPEPWPAEKAQPNA